MICKNLIVLICSYLPLQEVYNIVKDNLYQSHQILDYTNINLDNVTLHDFWIKGIDVQKYHVIDKSWSLIEPDSTGLISYKNLPFIIRGPELYTEEGIYRPDYRHTNYKNLYVIKSKIDDKLLHVLDQIHINQCKLIVSYSKTLNISAYYIPKIVPKIHEYQKDPMTKHFIEPKIAKVYWNLDNTIFFDLEGHIYSRDTLSDRAFKYIPILQVKAIGDLRIITGLRYVIVTELL